VCTSSGAAATRALYVGTSSSIATRVRSYFTAAEKRARISEMLAAAERVEAIECAHSLEAEVRELRLIAAHKPPTTGARSSPSGCSGSSSRRGLPAPVVVRQVATTAPPTWAVRIAAGGRAGGGGRLRRAAAAPVHPQAVGPQDDAGLRAR
jgi:hypothetical protein